jgi:myosin regulatory light chain 12
VSDTIIYRADLDTGLISLRRSGQTPSTSLLQTLLTPPSGSVPSGSQPRSINFAQFLTLFGQKLLELDTEQEILDAFACFDEDDDGLIDVPRDKGRMMGQEEEVDRVGEPAGLRGWLKEYGDRMTDKEVSPIAVTCH